MARQEEPRVGLDHRDVAERAAAVRALARAGSLDDVPRLVQMAVGDKSPSVRLYAAAAASDLAAAHRGAAGQQRLTPDQARELHALMRGLDPGVNPGLLMLYSAVADDLSIERLGRMLRDPRNGVRAGAITALRRMALSGAAAGDERVPGAVASWLQSGRLPPDAVSGLIEVVGEAGWPGLELAVQQAAAGARQAGPALEAMRSRQEARRDPGTWEGFWRCTGADVFQPPTEEADARWMVVYARRVSAPGAQVEDLTLGEVATIGADPVRLVWAPMVGRQGRFVALQCSGSTWWRVEAKELVREVDGLLEGLGDAPVACQALAQWFAEVEGPLAVRARALVLWKAGDLEAAEELLGQLASHKRPRADVYWWLGCVRAEAGRGADALQALERYLDKAGKRAAHRPAAEALVASLR